MAQKKQNNRPQQPNLQDTSNVENNKFFKGMTKDPDMVLVGKENWTHCVNCINNSAKGDAGVIGNEPANLLCADVPYEIIGGIHLFGDKWVLYSTDDTSSEIGIFDDSKCEYKTFINDPCLNFDRRYLITGASKENFDCSWQVYWDDHAHNPSRTLNLGPVTDDGWFTDINVPWFKNAVIIDENGTPSVIEDENDIGSDPENCVSYVNATPLTLDCDLIRLAPLMKTPCIEVSKAEGGGQLKNGSYQVFIAYTVNENKIGDYIAYSEIQALWDHDDMSGSLDIKITNLDTNFEFFELVVLYNHQMQQVAKRIGFYSTVVAGSDIKEITLDFIDPKLQSIDESTLPSQNPRYERSDKMYPLNDYLIRQGPYEQFDFNYQCQANAIETMWVSTQFPDTYYRKGGNKPTFMRDEQYAFFIRFVYTTGERSSSYHIPGRAPDIYPDGSAVLNGFGGDTGNGLVATYAIPGSAETQNWQVVNTATEVVGAPGIGATTEDGGVVIAKGYMGYWESTERYPSTDQARWCELCGDNIRHHKMPDENTCVATERSTVGIGGSFINILGVEFNNISRPTFNDGTIITNISGYEILVGSRKGAKSIIAKGLFRNMRSYNPVVGDPETGTNTQIGLFANYPFNDQHPDFYHLMPGSDPATTPVGDQPNELLDNDPTGRGFAINNIFTFHSPETSFNRPFLSPYEVKTYGRTLGNAVGRFKRSEDHPKHKLIRDIAAIVAAIIGAGYAIQEMRGEKVQRVKGTSALSIGKQSGPYENRDQAYSGSVDQNPFTVTTSPWWTPVMGGANITATGGGPLNYNNLSIDDDFQDIPTDQTPTGNPLGDEFMDGSAPGPQNSAVANNATVNMNDLETGQQQPGVGQEDATSDLIVDSSTLTSSLDITNPLNLLPPSLGGTSPQEQSMIMSTTPLDPTTSISGAEEEYLQDINARNEDAATDQNTRGYSGPSREIESRGSKFKGLPGFLQIMFKIHTFLNMMVTGGQEIVELIYNLMSYQDYVYKYNGYGLYYSHQCEYHPNCNGYIAGLQNRAEIDKAIYISNAFQNLGTSVYANNLRINNLQRPKTVVVSTLQNLPNQGLFDNSRQTIGSLGGWMNPTAGFLSNISGHYVGLKMQFENQYGQLDDILQLPTNCVTEMGRIEINGVPQIPNVADRFTSPVMYGGDCYLNRYSEKVIMPFFWDFLKGEPDGFNFNYYEHQNIPNTRYWYNADRYNLSGLVQPMTDLTFSWLSDPNNPGLPSAMHNLDAGADANYSTNAISNPGTSGGSGWGGGTFTSGGSTTAPGGFFTSGSGGPAPAGAAPTALEKNGMFTIKGRQMYVHSSGVNEFYVESELNMGLRDWEDQRGKRHYDFQEFTDLTELFHAEIIKDGNFYKYDHSLSKTNFFTQSISFGFIQDRSYDPVVAFNCLTHYPKRVIYSLQAQKEAKKDFWRIFLPNNYKDFKNVPNVIKPISKTGALILFPHNAPQQFQGVDTLTTEGDVKITIGDAGLFSQPFQNVVNADLSHEYGSCESMRSVINTPTGLYFISQAQGKIFNYTGQLEAISDIGMKQWFNKYLPSQLIKAFPNMENYVDADNPVVGVGCQSVYDPNYDLVYFCKKDYAPIEDNECLEYNPDFGFVINNTSCYGTEQTLSCPDDSQTLYEVGEIHPITGETVTEPVCCDYESYENSWSYTASPTIDCNDVSSDVGSPPIGGILGDYNPNILTIPNPSFELGWADSSSDSYGNWNSYDYEQALITTFAGSNSYFWNLYRNGYTPLPWDQCMDGPDCGEWTQLDSSIFDPSVYPPIMMPVTADETPCGGCKMTPDTLPMKHGVSTTSASYGLFMSTYTEPSSEGNNHIGLYHNTTEPSSYSSVMSWNCVSDTDKLAQAWQEGVAAPLSGNLTIGTTYSGSIDIKKPQYDKDLIQSLQMRPITTIGQVTTGIRWNVIGSFTQSDYDNYNPANYTGSDDIFYDGLFDYDADMAWNINDNDRRWFVHNAGLLGTGFTIPHFNVDTGFGATQEIGGGISGGNPNAWWMAGVDSNQWELFRYGPAEIEIWGGWGNCPGFDDDSSYQNYGPYTSEPSELLWSSGPVENFDWQTFNYSFVPSNNWNWLYIRIRSTMTNDQAAERCQELQDLGVWAGPPTNTGVAELFNPIDATTGDPFFSYGTDFWDDPIDNGWFYYYRLEGVNQMSPFDDAFDSFNASQVWDVDWGPLSIFERHNIRDTYLFVDNFVAPLEGDPVSSSEECECYCDTGWDMVLASDLVTPATEEDCLLQGTEDLPEQTDVILGYDEGNTFTDVITAGTYAWNVTNPSFEMGSQDYNYLYGLDVYSNYSFGDCNFSFGFRPYQSSQEMQEYYWDLGAPGISVYTPLPWIRCQQNLNNFNASLFEQQLPDPITGVDALSPDALPAKHTLQLSAMLPYENSMSAALLNYFGEPCTMFSVNTWQEYLYFPPAFASNFPDWDGFAYNSSTWGTDNIGYLGLVHSLTATNQFDGVNWQEGVSQELSIPLVAGEEYVGSIDVLRPYNADAPWYSEHGGKIIILGGDVPCCMNEVLWVSSSATGWELNEWETKSFEFTPNANHSYIQIMLETEDPRFIPYNYTATNTADSIPASGKWVSPSSWSTYMDDAGSYLMIDNFTGFANKTDIEVDVTPEYDWCKCEPEEYYTMVDEITLVPITEEQCLEGDGVRAICVRNEVVVEPVEVMCVQAGNTTSESGGCTPAIYEDDLTEVDLTDENYFKDVSWTVSFDPKAKAWISFHDWHPDLTFPSLDHFLTTKYSASDLVECPPNYIYNEDTGFCELQTTISDPADITHNWYSCSSENPVLAPIDVVFAIDMTSSTGGYTKDPEAFPSTPVWQVTNEDGEVRMRGTVWESQLGFINKFVEFFQDEMENGSMQVGVRSWSDEAILARYSQTLDMAWEFDGQATTIPTFMYRRPISEFEDYTDNNFSYNQVRNSFHNNYLIDEMGIDPFAATEITDLIFHPTDGMLTGGDEYADYNWQNDPCSGPFLASQFVFNNDSGLGIEAYVTGWKGFNVTPGSYNSNTGKPFSMTNIPFTLGEDNVPFWGGGTAPYEGGLLAGTNQLLDTTNSMLGSRVGQEGYRRILIIMTDGYANEGVLNNYYQANMNGTSCALGLGTGCDFNGEQNVEIYAMFSNPGGLCFDDVSPTVQNTLCSITCEDPADSVKTFAFGPGGSIDNITTSNDIIIYSATGTWSEPETLSGIWTPDFNEVLPAGSTVYEYAQMVMDSQYAEMVGLTQSGNAIENLNEDDIQQRYDNTISSFDSGNCDSDSDILQQFVQQVINVDETQRCVCDDGYESIVVTEEGGSAGPVETTYCVQADCDCKDVASLYGIAQSEFELTGECDDPIEWAWANIIPSDGPVDPYINPNPPMCFYDDVSQVEGTTTSGSIWRHNVRCDVFSNYYYFQYPWEIEFVESTGQMVNTIRNVEYELESYIYKQAKDAEGELIFGYSDCDSRWHDLDWNFNRAYIYNTEQVSGYLHLNLTPKNNAPELNNYPSIEIDINDNSNSYIDILYSKEEQKYRFNQFWDITKNRGEIITPTGDFDSNAIVSQQAIMWTDLNGYIRDLNSLNLEYDKPPHERKKFRHYWNKIVLRREPEIDADGNRIDERRKMLLKLENTKINLSMR